MTPPGQYVGISTNKGGDARDHSRNRINACREKEDKKAKKSKKSKDGAEEEGSPEPSATEVEDADEDDSAEDAEDDVVWMTDTSEAAVAARAAQQLTGATADMVTQVRMQTNFGGGDWDSILTSIQFILHRGRCGPKRDTKARGFQRSLPRDGNGLHDVGHRDEWPTSWSSRCPAQSHHHWHLAVTPASSRVQGNIEAERVEEQKRQDKVRQKEEARLAAEQVIAAARAVEEAARLKVRHRSDSGFTFKGSAWRSRHCQKSSMHVSLHAPRAS